MKGWMGGRDDRTAYSIAKPMPVAKALFAAPLASSARDGDQARSLSWRTDKEIVKLTSPGLDRRKDLESATVTQVKIMCECAELVMNRPGY
ncbi:hypothetical protein RRG08_042805 [Elysia crispata]|uniref:Uncharacterized protein n=1 Tax=Elysia crispata TaxID=231223 RepID=A0AAE0YCT7_9GAST|nr:hypothetical protein RRG08_042805 [Elysia crispata]